MSRIDIVGNSKKKLDFAYKQAHNIFLMNGKTPGYMNNKYEVDDLAAYLNEEYAKLMAPEDYLAGLNAVISHDIYKSSKSSPSGIKEIIKADMLIISSTQDHLVNPIAAVELAEELDAQLIMLDSDCGHGAFTCETERIKSGITVFLKE